jgi:DNA-binding GntR family transcriptional regulator
VREALLKLASEEDLVVAEPQVGFRVRPISTDDLEELTEARRVMEAEVFRISIEQGDLEWESRVIASHHRLTRVPQMDPDDPARISDEWSRAHATFHETLLSGCTNARLRQVALTWRAAAELYRRWSVTTPHQGRDVAAEHRALCDAAVAREVDRGVELLRAHISATTQALLAGEQAAAHP